MARYDYDCAACGTRFEVVHGVHADPPVDCPVCGGGPIKKAFAPPTIHFKGSGWAKKERRSAAGSSSGKARGSEGSTTSSSEGAGTDGPSSSDSDTGGADASPSATSAPATAAARTGTEASSKPASD